MENNEEGVKQSLKSYNIPLLSKVLDHETVLSICSNMNVFPHVVLICRNWLEYRQRHASDENNAYVWP
jgi:hypothetical protein